jgi:hypothetical protein
MTKKQAEQAGYSFHGAYDHNKEKIKERAAQLRKEGNKAIVITEKPDRLSRGHRGDGYSVYWIESDANVAARKAIYLANRKQQLMNEKAKLLARIEEIEAELNTEEA